MIVIRCQKMSSTMLRKVILLLLFQSVYLTVITRGEANITVPPKSVNISLNGEAEFNCTGIGSTFFWKANGTELSNGGKKFIAPPLLVDGVQGLKMSTLRVTVASTDNATNITCTVIKLSPFSISNESEPALLLVQGLLKSVSNLNATIINSTTVLISWSPPFTLEGVPILGYNVTITTSSGENETMSVEGDTNMLYYSIDHSDPDSNCTVTVVSANVLGVGEPATITFCNDALSHCIATATNYSTTVTVIKSSTISVYATVPTVSFTITPDSDSPGNVTTSVMVLVLIAVIIFALIVVLLIVVCFFHHRKRPIIIKTEVVLPSQDVMPVISNNPAYNKLVTLRNLKEAGCTFSNTKESVPDYENIEELYFKQKIKDKDNTIEGDYEPVECSS